MELATRTHARSLLTDDMRTWLEHIEHAQQAATLTELGLSTAEPQGGPDAPDTAAELHLALTIADRAERGT